MSFNFYLTKFTHNFIVFFLKLNINIKMLKKYVNVVLIFVRIYIGNHFVLFPPKGQAV